MTDEIDVLKKAIAEHEKALHLKNLNQELNSHLTGSVYWLLKHSEKYNIPLPKKDELLRMLEKSDFMINAIISASEQETPKLKENFNDKTPIMLPEIEVKPRILTKKKIISKLRHLTRTCSLEIISDT
ncbi:MAG TPA: hypothetical protein VGR54_04030 [Nitrosopumilaceae archaeon]|nr:hypothetical protein [Nitrosopumilaceae archaeon]